MDGLTVEGEGEENNCLQFEKLLLQLRVTVRDGIFLFFQGLDPTFFGTRFT